VEIVYYAIEASEMIFMPERIRVEVLTANPPTLKCREVVMNLKEAIKGLERYLEIYVVKQGQTLPRGIFPTQGLVRAFKTRSIPGIVIDGHLIFSRIVPSSQEIRNEIIKALKNKNIEVDAK